MMRICNRCIQPDTRPGIYFDDQGICGACIWEEKKKEINWKSREKELRDIAEWAKKTTKSNYDCAIGVSGGKDSTKQALTARDLLGLRCLLVNSEPEGITELGRYNIENLKQLNQVLGLKFKRILFDNMNTKQLRKCLKLCKNKYETEYSGNADLKNIKNLSNTGINRISVGAITHSAKSFDTSLLFN